jgi:hypothetical protein
VLWKWTQRVDMHHAPPRRCHSANASAPCYTAHRVSRCGLPGPIDSSNGSRPSNGLWPHVAEAIGRHVDDEAVGVSLQLRLLFFGHVIPTTYSTRRRAALSGSGRWRRMASASSCSSAVGITRFPASSPAASPTGHSGQPVVLAVGFESEYELYFVFLRVIGHLGKEYIEQLVEQAARWKSPQRRAR